MTRGGQENKEGQGKEGCRAEGQETAQGTLMPSM